MTPAISEAQAMTSSRQAMGRSKCRASNLGHEPSLDASTAGMPRIRPIHQVAITPHPKANRIGASVWKTGGWPMVKYSRRPVPSPDRAECRTPRRPRCTTVRSSTIP